MSRAVLDELGLPAMGCYGTCGTVVPGSWRSRPIRVLSDVA